VSGLRWMTAEEAIHAEEMVSEEVGRPCDGNWHTHEQVWAAGGRVPAGGGRRGDAIVANRQVWEGNGRHGALFKHRSLSACVVSGGLRWACGLGIIILPFVGQLEPTEEKLTFFRHQRPSWNLLYIKKITAGLSPWTQRKLCFFPSVLTGRQKFNFLRQFL
jgi:hypothetical protein